MIFLIVVVDRSVFPATVTRNTDVDLDYTIKELSTDPKQVHDIDMFMANYSMRESVLVNQRNKLRETAADSIIFQWQDGLPAGSIVKTTGSDSATNLPHGTATGTRKALTLDDFILANQTLLAQGYSTV